MLRFQLHPTSLGFVSGLVLVALWAILWTIFLVHLAAHPEAQARRHLPVQARLVAASSSSATA
jgi:hypothetical protein